MREEANTAVLELLLAEQSSGGLHRSSAPGVVVGTLTGLDPARGPLVRMPDDAAGVGVPARSIVALDERHVGHELVLALERGDPARPIVLGVILAPDAAAAEASPEPESIAITATRDLVLRCGKASITLTRAGKVLLRGAYLLSRSSGANRIKGGSVQIN